MEKYFEKIEKETENAYNVAEKARNQAKDPEERVDIPVAKDLAEKASSLVIAAQFEELENKGVAERIRELEEKYGKNDERVAFQIGREIAEGKFYQFDDTERACDAGVRVGVSYMTGGITTAPLEGISDVKVRKNNDGSEYLAVYYAGPIRSAGGTASAMSVMLADYVRIGAGLDKFKPSEKIIKRYATEVEDYYNRVTAKQYDPEREETKKIASNVPIEVTGTPTERIEVSNHKDIEKINTNRIRGGMCLVYLDGLPLKASKLKKRVESFGEEFGLEHWQWIEEYLELQEEIHSEENNNGNEEENKVKTNYTPSDKYLDSLTAGRPVFGHPGEKGGFRLRYAHTRTNGMAAVSFHPATMEITQRFISTGTQLKIEYPGKATVGTPSNSAHPPIVRLKNGDVLKVETREKARKLEDQVEEILFLGDIMVTVGEFIENGKDLLPSPYVEEWWKKELEKELEKQDKKLGKDFSERKPSPEEAFKISDVLEIPLHPKWSYHWRETSVDRFKALYNSVKNGNIKGEKSKKCLEDILLPHRQTEEGEIKLKQDHLKVLKTILKPEEDNQDLLENLEDPEEIPEIIETISGYKLKEQAPHYIGARMGRPEKAERRTIEGKPQILFPCGKEEGGRMRNLISSYKNETVRESIIHNKCPECNKITHYNYCPECEIKADPVYFCSGCSKRYDEEKPKKCSKCGEKTFRRHKKTEIKIKEMMDKATKNIGIKKLPELLKSVRGMSSKNKDVEPLEKGLLREKKDLYVNKDGTVRYDASDLPMTHFKPKEISVSVEKLKEIGYNEDINGNPLKEEDQVLELKPQDIIIPDGENTLAASDYMKRVADFIDDLLEKFYGLEPYYNIEDKEDLVGELIIGLAPHTSGGTVGRIIGFTDAKGIYAHPYWHAAKRRNCLPGESKVKIPGKRDKTLREIFENANTPREADNTGTVEKSINLEVETEKNNQITTSKATKVIKTPSQEFKIIFKTKYGRKHIVYPDHKVKTTEGIKRARNIEEGDKLLVKAEIEENSQLETITHQDTKTTQKQLQVLEEEITTKEIKKSQERFMYDLEVKETHNFITNDNIITSNCDGDEDAILLMMDGLLNFSRQFLPDVRGARTMDAPLILSTRLNADEIDDEAWAIETVSEYPLGFYEETQKYKKPWELENEIQIGEDIVETQDPYQHSYTHETENIENCPTQSEYVTLNEMSEKTSSQLKLGEKIKAVDEDRVAELLLDKHFVPDIKGNLRSFSSQKMRCVDCNTKFRRVPMTNQTIAASGKVTAQCPECDGDVLLTISEGTIRKYLEPSQEIIDNYQVSPYMRQQVMILNRTIQSLFGKNQRQSGLAQFTG